MTIDALPRPGRKAVAVSSSLMTLMLALGTVTTAANRAHAAPEKFKLVYKAQQGQVKKAKGSALIKFAVSGQDVSIEQSGTDKITYSEVKPTGEITYIDETEALEITANGQKQEVPAEVMDDKTIVTMKPNGLIVGFKEENSDDEDEGDDNLTVRLISATTPVFSDKEVGVGDKWSQEFKASSDLGTRDARADYEVLALEKVGAVDCVKIKVEYAEKGSKALTGKGTLWVERSSGDTVKADFDVEGVPFGPPQAAVAASVKLTEERTQGGPLPGSAATGATADAKKPEPKKDKTIDEVVKDFQKLPGGLTLYRKKEPTKDTIYLEIPEAKLGQLMMLQATASTGTSDQIVTGDPINDIVFKFEKQQDDKLLMVVPNTYFKADNPELARAMKRSFADGYIGSFKVEAKQAERKSLLIDVSEVFRGDLAQISAAFSGGALIPGLPSAGGGFGLDREKTYVDTVKNFPDNLVVTTQYHFQRGGMRASSGALADPRSAPFAVTYNLFALPTDNGYVPRLADPRIGYFLTEFQTFDNDAAEDPLLRYILRWDLRKKDPTAAHSEPVRPIVFWLDNAIPTYYRDSVRDGILVWNRAFEKIGFKDAIVVKQMPDNPDGKDANVPTDTADMRFNFVRWVVSPGSAYAVALFRPNPITGQILNASITVDAGIVRAFKLERNAIVDPATAFARGAGMDIDEALFQSKVPLSEAAETVMRATAGGKLGQSHIGHDPRYCRLGGDQFRERAWFGYTAASLLGQELAAAGKRNPLVNEKEYAQQIIRETVAHEMGHILGLRHNFVASTQFSLEELKDAKRVKEGGIGASVMDYNPFNISALKTPGVDFFSQTIGVYDYWAVEYGYKPFGDVKKPIDETFQLRQVAKLSNMPGHAYQSDEQALIGFDPRVVQYDLSSDPLAYWEKSIEVSKHLLTNLDKRLPRSGESYYEFTRAFNQLLGIYARSAGVASRYVGGLNVNRNHKGDPGEKPTLSPVDVAEQKRALALLNAFLFSPAAMNFPTSYYGKLTTDPYGLDFAADFPIQDQISGIQKAALTRLFSGGVLTRVANNEFKRGGDPNRALTMTTLFDSVGKNVWSELGTRGNVSALRRQLQRAHLDRMAEMATRPGSAPEDARMLAWNELKSLKKRLTASLANPTLDRYTQIHLTDSLDKVQRTLDAEVTLGGSAPAAAPNLLQMLLGGKDGEAALPQRK